MTVKHTGFAARKVDAIMKKIMTKDSFRMWRIAMDTTFRRLDRSRDGLIPPSLGKSFSKSFMLSVDGKYMGVRSREIQR